MKRSPIRLVLLFALGMLGQACGANLLRADDEVKPKLDPQVAKVLDQMTAYLAGRTSSSVTMTMTMKGGGFAATDSSYAIRFEKPNRLMLDLKSGGQGITLVSDGKTLVTYLAELKQYTEEAAPDNLADVDNIFLSGLNQFPLTLAIPGDNLKRSILEQVNSSTYVGKETVDGVEYEHVRFAQDDADWDLWVTAGDKSLAHKIVVDIGRSFPVPAGEQPKKVEMVLALNDWKIDYAPQPADFSFTPPQDATKVESLFGAPRETGPHPLLGKDAPEFKLDLFGGGEVDLKALKGMNVVILDFWATWCGPCREALPTIAKVAEKYKSRGVLLFAVNIQEEPEQVKEFLDDQKLNVTVALDKEGAVAGAYLASAIPQTVLIGKDGKVQVVHVGLASNLEESLTQQIEALLEGQDLAAEELKKAEEAKQAKAAKQAENEKADEVGEESRTDEAKPE